MASNLVEVCNILVAYNYGQISQRIFSYLAQNGRASLGGIRYTLRDVPLVRVKRSLTQLIQHRLVCHHLHDPHDTQNPDAGNTYYTIYWHTAYGLIRNGRVVTMVQDRYGEAAATVMAMLLQVGHCKIGDLAGVFNFDEAVASKGNSGLDSPAPHVNGNGLPNGVHKDTAKDDGTVNSILQLHAVLGKLLKAGILMKVGSHTFKSRQDVEGEAETVVMKEMFPDGKVSGPKKQTEFRREVDRLKRKWRDEADFNADRDADSRGSIHRPGMNGVNPHKRQRINGGYTNGIAHEDPSIKLPNDMSVAVNLEKCVVAMRSDSLVRFARQYLGHVTATVYRALLTALESKVREVRDPYADYDDEGEDERAASVNIFEVVGLVDPDIDLAVSIKGAKSELPNGGPKARKKINIEYDNDFGDIGIKREADSDDEEANGYSAMGKQSRRIDLVEQHLKLLQEHDKEFCRNANAAGSSEWSVGFVRLTEALINAEIDTTIDRRYGKPALRIARMLREEGKLEEKFVAQKVLRHVKDIRGVLAQMQAGGFLEAQEVPKDQYRQPTRSLYLWYFDEKKVQHLILQQSYQAMARCMQRMDVEKERFQQILDKRERLRGGNVDTTPSFIVGKTGMLEEEGAQLSKVEKEQLAQWRAVQERLLTQAARIDDVVAVMRDFDGRDVSMF